METAVCPCSSATLASKCQGPHETHSSSPHTHTPAPHPTNAPRRCRARRLTDEQRSAIASYFAVYKGQEKGVAKLALSLDDHPAVARAYALLSDAFEQVGGAGRRRRDGVV